LTIDVWILVGNGDGAPRRIVIKGFDHRLALLAEAEDADALAGEVTNVHGEAMSFEL
jgi:hypothetical protein